MAVSQPGPNLQDETKARRDTAVRLERFAKEFCNLVEESQTIFSV